jgi:hypothetical protein
MGRKTTEETKASGQPKKTLRPRATQQQPPPPGEPKKKRQRTEVAFQVTQNPEEEDRAQMQAELDKDHKMASAAPSKRKRHEKVSPPQLTSSV